MVARIKTGKNLPGAVNYNEQKVKKGQAVLLSANLYGKDLTALTIHEKINRLKNLAAINTRTTTNCLHVSLNFHVNEHLDRPSLINIADSYMDKIGFGKQPYLVYQHEDAAHPHVHIVTTNVQRDGKRISMHNLGKLKSETARKEIEIQFGLIKAGDQSTKKHIPLNPVKVAQLRYGQHEYKRTIGNIVNQILREYHFTSIPAFNAVLNNYNIYVDAGSEESRLRKNGGLLYGCLGEDGQKVGVPIKASSLPAKPTLRALEKFFLDSESARAPFKESLKIKILDAANNSMDQSDFTNRLSLLGVVPVFRINNKGLLYGITYIDNSSKTVFNGSDLGKEYSAAAIRKRWISVSNLSKNQPVRLVKAEQKLPDFFLTPPNKIADPQYILTEPSADQGYIPHHLKKKRKRKPKTRL